MSTVTVEEKRLGSDIQIIEDEPEVTFSRSIVISGIRCALTYVVFPFVTPLLGLAPGVGPTIGLFVGLFAIGANVYSIRRFWMADHKYKKLVTGLHLAVIGLLLVLLVLDIDALL